MTTIETSKLTDVALDRAVAKCKGQTYHGPAWTKYSTDWAQAGPIIEREEINIGTVLCDGRFYWTATMRLSEAEGPTPLIAAMRCYVASKLGDEVNVPEELK